jgi:hypothetical protein
MFGSSCLLKQVNEGNIEEKGRRGRRRTQLLDGLREKRRYWKLKEKALARPVWRTLCGRTYGPVVRPIG